MIFNRTGEEHCAIQNPMLSLWWQNIYYLWIRVARCVLLPV